MSGIQKLFAEVPDTYQFVNHLLTGGLDIVWRRRAVRFAAGAPGGLWLDVCSGTGETALYLSRAAPPGTAVHAVDFSIPMLRQLRTAKGADAIRLAAAEVGRLPFPDETFEVVTISFATRNINTSRTALIRRLEEFRRVLRPGGRFVNVETSQPRSRLLRALVHGYVKSLVKPVGGAISGSSAAYRYLSETIPRFYPPEDFAGIIGEAGFREVGFTTLSFGVAAIHHATR
jgi:demethylmenaquinone methyltransferase/2-methoxy-6-polyprenyl-1,4-benzoquinol methylase